MDHKFHEQRSYVIMLIMLILQSVVTTILNPTTILSLPY